MNKFGEELLFHLIDVHIADDMGKAPQFMQRIETYRAARQTIVHLLEKQECFSLKQLAVNGNDIKRLGFSGKEIGAVLEELLSEVIDGKCENEKTKLLKAAQKIRSNHNERS